MKNKHPIWKDILTYLVVFFIGYYFLGNDIFSCSPSNLSNKTPDSVKTSTPFVVAPVNTTPTVTASSKALPAPSPTAEASEIKSSLDALQHLSISNETISKKYQWTYLGRQWTWELKYNQWLYDYYKSLPRSPSKDYSVYITHPLDDKQISQLADSLCESAKKQGYNEFQTVSFAAAFVQSLPYTNDSVTTGYDEYPRFPIETLVDNGGDCEDTAILMAALTRAMNYGVVLLRFSETTRNSGHLAVGIKCADGTVGTYWTYEGGKYYYLETTGTGWDIGEIPDDYRDASANIYSMKPVPILTHTWSYEGTTRLIELKVIVDNLGSANATGVYVEAGFDAGNDTWWNSKESLKADIGVNGIVTYTMSLKPPAGEYTRLIVRIIYNGYTVDKSYSKWFGP